jgi:hypothetical protein
MDYSQYYEEQRSRQAEIEANTRKFPARITYFEEGRLEQVNEEEGRWRVIKPYVATLRFDGRGFDIYVQEGFVTDQASVPRVMWPFIPPFGRHTFAAVIHDFCCVHALDSMAFATEAFHSFLYLNSVPNPKRYLMVKAVGLRPRGAYATRLDAPSYKE